MSFLADWGLEQQRNERRAARGDFSELSLSPSGYALLVGFLQFDGNDYLFNDLLTLHLG